MTVQSKALLKTIALDVHDGFEPDSAVPARDSSDHSVEFSPHGELQEEQGSDEIVCPVCGAKCVQRRCKVVCESERCRGRVIFNCSEF
jgi:hypothetical protein